MAGKQAQTLISRRGEEATGYALRLDEGHLSLEIGGQAVATEHVAVSGEWYFAAAVYDSEAQRARLYLEQRSGVVPVQFGVTEGALALSPAAGPGDLLISAELVDEDVEQVPGRFYNGKIDSPRIYDRTLSDAELSALRDEGGDEVRRGLLAAWDFSRDISNWTVSDGSGNEHHGSAINKPLRGVTGQNWDGSELAWPRAPEQYGAIHFHDDDLSDAGWTVSFEWTVPEGPAERPLRGAGVLRGR